MCEGEVMEEYSLDHLDRKTNNWAHGSITDKEYMFWVCAFIETQREEIEKARNAVQNKE